MNAATGIDRRNPKLFAAIKTPLSECPYCWDGVSAHPADHETRPPGHRFIFYLKEWGMCWDEAIGAVEPFTGVPA